VNLDSPTTARLNPAPAHDVPIGFSVVRAEISEGLPFRLPFEPFGLRAVLTVPAGLVRHWLATPADQVIARSAEQREPAPGTGAPDTALAAARSGAGPRILLIDSAGLVGSCPLVVGRRFLVPARGRGSASASFELVILSFTLFAGSLVGPGGAGSRIEFAWRGLLAGADRFDGVVCRGELQSALSYTTGPRGDRRRVRVDAEVGSIGERVSGDGSPTGGIDWDLRHGRP